MKSSILSGKSARLVATFDAENIANDWIQVLHVDVGDQFRQLGTIQLWECQETGLRFYSPADAAGGENLYTQLEAFDWYYMADKWEFQEALSMLPKSSNLLEVGVGNGHFLQVAKEKGHNCCGLELNSNAAMRVRELGFEIYEKSLDQFANHYQSRFDVICSFQVLEHVTSPLEFLEGMVALLRPGGSLILSVPNAAVMRRIDPDNKSLLNQPPHHMSHWDASVFRSLEGILPVELKTIRREPLATYHVAWMVKGYLRNALRSTGPSISRLLINRFTTLPIQLGLRAGLKDFLPGHTILVELELLPSN
jgi:SAM-dependent methyltransferase